MFVVFIIQYIMEKKWLLGSGENNKFCVRWSNRVELHVTEKYLDAMIPWYSATKTKQCGVGIIRTVMLICLAFSAFSDQS